MKITTKEYPQIVKLMKATYPDYTGRKFRLETTDSPFETHSYWDGGSKTYYKFVRADGKVMAVDSLAAPWTQYEQNRKAQLVPGLACVKHCIFCGHDLGLTIMLHPEDMPKQITA